MNTRDLNLATGMIEPAERTVGGITLRPFSYGSMQLAYMLNLSLFTEEEGADPDDAEMQRQVVTFAWMQSAPIDEVVDAILSKSVEGRVLRYSLNITFDQIPHLIGEIRRIGEMVAASNVRAESRYGNDTETPPGKS